MLLEETDWLGGQLTAQGVSALDEHEHIEAFGGTASYYRLRELVARALSRRAGDAARQPISIRATAGSRALAFEPRVAVEAIERDAARRTSTPAG